MPRPLPSVQELGRMAGEAIASDPRQEAYVRELVEGMKRPRCFARAFYFAKMRTYDRNLTIIIIYVLFIAWIQKHTKAVIMAF